MYKESNIKKVVRKGKTIIDLTTKTATTFKSVAEAKKTFLSWTKIQDCTPLSHYFFKEKRR